MRIEITPYPLSLTYKIIQYCGTIYIKDNISNKEFRFNKGVLYYVNGRDAIYDILQTGGEVELSTNQVITYLMMYVSLCVTAPQHHALIDEFFKKCY